MKVKQVWKSKTGRLMVFILPLLIVILIIILRSRSSLDLPNAEVKSGVFLVSITETGELRATNSTVITAPPIRTNLQIVALAPKGKEVEKGDTLIVFDGAEVKTRIEEKSAELEIAQANLQKSVASIASNIAQLEASVKSSEASYRQAQLRLQQTQFEAEAVKEAYQLDLLQSQINLEQSKTRLEQQLTIDSAEVRTLELRVAQALSDLQSAQRDMDKLTVLAPQPGLVVYKKIWKGDGLSEVKVGDSPWRGLALIELPDLSQMEVITSINEVDVAKVAPEQKAKIVLDAFPEREFSGKITEVSNLARTDEESVGEVKVFDVVILIEGQDAILKPGMTVSATIEIETVPEALSIPIDAVFSDGGKHIVYRLEGSYKPVEVKLGVRNTNFVVIEEGLKRGDRVCLIDPTKPYDKSLLTEPSVEKEEEQEEPKKQNRETGRSERRNRR